MSAVLQALEVSVPLFVLVGLGYLLATSGRWPKTVSDALASFTFAVALPALMFRMMSDPARMPPFDARILAVYFGSCLVTFAVGRAISAIVFRLDGVSQSVFALGGVFSNAVLLGVPLAKSMLGEAALSPLALLLVFHTMVLWTLVTASVEWSRHGALSLEGFARTARRVVTTPVVAAVLAGTLAGALRVPIPRLVDEPLRLVGQSATPLALIVVGMGLAEYGVRTGWRAGLGITALKLLVQPFVVMGLAHLLGLPRLETQVVVLLASLAVGVNVYLMARHFDVVQGPVASSMVVSTALSAVTMPLVLALV